MIFESVKSRRYHANQEEMDAITDSDDSSSFLHELWSSVMNEGEHLFRHGTESDEDHKGNKRKKWISDMN